MAKKKEKPKNVLERIYNIPLRKEFQKSPRWKRTKKAVKALREFIVKHMKSEDVKVGKYLNEKLWQHGIKNPPHHIKVKASKDEKGKVFVELAELPKEAVFEKEKKEKKDKEKEAKEKSKEEKKPEEKEPKEKEEKIEEKAEEAKQGKEEETRKAEKEELKELKKETPKIKAPKPAAMPKQVEQRPTAPMKK